jgi:hypothetical protein
VVALEEGALGGRHPLKDVRHGHVEVDLYDAMGAFGHVFFLLLGASGARQF